MPEHDIQARIARVEQEVADLRSRLDDRLDYLDHLQRRLRTDTPAAAAATQRSRKVRRTSIYYRILKYLSEAGSPVAVHTLRDAFDAAYINKHIVRECQLGHRPELVLDSGAVRLSSEGKRYLVHVETLNSRK